MSETKITNGPQRRRGKFRPGDYVQLTDSKGRMHTILLKAGGFFQSHRATLRHDQIIGLEEGSVVTTPEGTKLLCVRPLLSDYVLSMPRGAAIIYPKDAAQIVQYADIFPGAKVLEAGLGSGALAMSLLNAIGPQGCLTSVERREDFATIAVSNVQLWYGQTPDYWQVELGEFSEVVAQLPAHSQDRVILDMLTPWEHLQQVHRVLTPGGVWCCYVATVSQLSRLAEEVSASELFAPMRAWETIEREWHLEGLAVRPVHRMIGHTGFLATMRSLAPDSQPLRKAKRPAKEADEQPGQWNDESSWEPSDVGQRPISEKKARRVSRQVSTRAQHWVEDAGGEASDD